MNVWGASGNFQEIWAIHNVRKLRLCRLHDQKSFAQPLASSLDSSDAYQDPYRISRFESKARSAQEDSVHGT